MSIKKYTPHILLLCLIISGKLTGFLKDLGMTYFLGVSEVTDAFFLATYISSLLYIAIYASIPLVVVPLIPEVEEQKVKQKKIIFTIYFLVSLFLTLFVELFSPLLIDFFSSHPNEMVKNKALSYLKVMAWTFPLSTLVAMCNAKQSVRKFTLLVYSVPIVTNLFFILALILIQDKYDFIFVLWAGVASWVLLLIVNFFVEYNRNYKFQLNIRLKEVILEFPAALSLIFSTTLILFIEQFNLYISVYFLSDFGDGAISIYTYANKLNLLILSTSLLVITTNIYPKLAQLNRLKDKTVFINFIIKSIRIIILLAFPFAILSSIYDLDIVKLVFLRGSFQTQDATAVAKIFGWLILALPCFIIRDFLTRANIAYGKEKFVIQSYGLVIAMNISIILLFSKSFGMLSIILGQIASLIFHLILLLIPLCNGNLKENIGNLIKELTSAVFYLFLVTLISFTLINRFNLNIFIGGGLYFLIYFALLFLFKEQQRFRHFLKL